MDTLLPGLLGSFEAFGYRYCNGTDKSKFQVTQFLGSVTTNAYVDFRVENEIRNAVQGCRIAHTGDWL